MPIWVGIDIGKSAVKVAAIRSSYRKTALVGLASVDIPVDRPSTLLTPPMGTQALGLDPSAPFGASLPSAAPLGSGAPITSAAAALSGLSSASAAAVSSIGPGVSGAPEGAADDASASSREQVAQAIREAVAMALGKAGNGDGVAAAIDGAKVMSRVLPIPASAQKQLAEVLPFELEAQVPFELDGSVFDYRVLTALRSLPGADPAMLPVLASVSRITEVRERIDLVKHAIGAEPERVGVGLLPLANWIPFSPALAEPGPLVVVDLGTLSSDILILRSGEPVFTRTISQGTAGLPETAPRLAREIRLTLAAYRATGGDSATRVYLCGGGAFVSGAESFLSNELETEVAVLPPPPIDYEVPQADQVRQLARYAKAIGLALGLGTRPLGLDLRKGPLAYERGFGWIRERIPVLAGLGAVIAVSFFFSACTQLYALGKESETVEKALATVTKEVLGEETTSPERANELLSQQTGADDDPMPHADAFDVMVRLSEAIPVSMTHDIEDLDVQKGHVSIHGIVGSMADAQSIVTSLKSEPCFSDVQIKRIDQVVGKEDRKKYGLEFDLKCPEDQKGKKKDPQAGTAPAASSASGGK
ncbi:pilus assembly protein PilM [Pendulispora albinea]|uniref:Pilus assembly protein PilM n=1 Tax=Pendulispora albinea TaxID=2741071 RepID=A0ABZ2LKL2_9BACT